MFSSPAESVVMAPYGLTRDSLSGDGDAGGNSDGTGDYGGGASGGGGGNIKGKGRRRRGSSGGQGSWGCRGPDASKRISWMNDWGATDSASDGEYMGEFSDGSFGGRLWGPEDY